MSADVLPLLNWILLTKLAWISLIWLLLITTPFLPDVLSKTLEKQYTTLSSSDIEELRGQVNILVLGAGFINDSLLTPNDQLSEAALGRLSEGIRIKRILPESKLITSGWGDREEITSAEVLAKTAILLGIDSSFLSTQKKPENTWQEATEYRRLYGDSTQLIIVTSAIHMPRAMYLFRLAELNPLAAPTNHLVKLGKHRDLWYWLPSSSNIKKMEAAIHEYIGKRWYKLGGSRIK